MPRKISALSEKTIRAVACGHNHTLALDTEQAAYTWGERPYQPSALKTNPKKDILPNVASVCLPLMVTERTFSN